MRIIDQGPISVVVSNEEWKLYHSIADSKAWPRKGHKLEERDQLLLKQLLIKGLIKKYRHEDSTYYKIVEKKNA